MRWFGEEVDWEGSGLGGDGMERDREGGVVGVDDGLVGNERDNEVENGHESVIDLDGDSSYLHGLLVLNVHQVVVVVDLSAKPSFFLSFDFPLDWIVKAQSRSKRQGAMNVGC